MNLLEFQFEYAPFVRHLVSLEHLEYHGELASKIAHYSFVREGVAGKLASATVIRAEEAELWTAFRELLDFGLKTAAGNLRGIFGFRLLSCELGARLDHLDWPKFSELLVLAGRKLAPGEKRPVRFGNLFGLFQKRVDAQWGKIECDSSVEVYRKSAAQLDLTVKKLCAALADSGAPTEDPIVILHDLSRDPLFKFGDEEQTERMRSFLEKTQKSFAGKKKPEIYVVNGRNVVELFTQFGM